MELTSQFPLEEVSQKIYEEFRQFLISYDAEMANCQIPPLTKTKLLSKGDFTVLLKGVLAKRKINVDTYTNDLVVKLQDYLVCWFTHNRTPIIDNYNRQTTQANYCTVPKQKQVSLTFSSIERAYSEKAYEFDFSSFFYPSSLS